MDVLVTGGAGYIGSHTAQALARAGFRPVVVDNLERGHREAVQWGPLIEADMDDRDKLSRVFREYRIEAVLHFAGFAYVGESMHSPERYFRNNVIKTVNLLEILREEGIGNFVFSSSCATYGYPRQIPIAEDHPQEPVSPYGESKLMVERVLRWYGQIHGLSWISLRYFNAAGADPGGELGEDHHPETHLIPLAISAAMAQIPHLEIYGSDYDTHDGTAVRDYLHVSDLASAHIRALHHLTSGGASTALNLGTGKGHSVRDVVMMVEQVTGRRVPVKAAPRREGDPPCLVAQPVAAQKLLDWTPCHSSLEEIVRTAWNWKAKAPFPSNTPPAAVPC